ncbi:MAG: hypothetical protein CFK52_09410 [Chloracidobacterium sp. CP2_5A]|nr:MAG: hypothetical protein CFK52_09410 [Chloracidobacterium sp. CP2_5A]
MPERVYMFPLNQRTPDWRRLFSGCFLAWLFFDLCVVHLLNPQYAAAELFGCAVPAVVAAPGAETETTTPGVRSAPAALEAAERSLPAHSCFWNTQSLLDAPTIALPLQRLALAATTKVAPSRSIWYFRLFPGSIFHPPRLA